MFWHFPGTAPEEMNTSMRVSDILCTFDEVTIIVATMYSLKHVTVFFCTQLLRKGTEKEPNTIIASQLTNPLILFHHW